MQTPAPNARLAARRDWADGLASFQVELLAGPPPPFQPGQFTNLALPQSGTWDAPDGRALKRAYSIASPPGAPSLEFFVRQVPGGTFTPRLFALEPGTPIWLDPRVAGHFTLAGAPDAEELLLVATGTGLAPFRSMLLDPRTRERFARVVLCYSDRTPRDLGYFEELDALARAGDWLRFLPTVTREPEASPWTGLRGRLQRHLEPDAYLRLTGAALTPERCQVFLCGNPHMISEVEAQLTGRGFKRHRRREPGQIHLERYW